LVKETVINLKSNFH